MAHHGTGGAGAASFYQGLSFRNKRKKVQALRLLLAIAQFPVIHTQPTAQLLRTIGVTFSEALYCCGRFPVTYRSAGRDFFGGGTF